MVASTSSTYKVLSALLVISWGSCPPDIAEKLKTILTEQCLYEETSPFLLSLQKDCHVREMHDKEPFNCSLMYSCSYYIHNIFIVH